MIQQSWHDTAWLLLEWYIKILLLAVYPRRVKWILQWQHQLTGLGKPSNLSAYGTKTSFGNSMKSAAAGTVWFITKLLMTFTKLVTQDPWKCRDKIKELKREYIKSPWQKRQQMKGSTLNGKSSRQYTWTQAFNRTPTVVESLDILDLMTKLRTCLVRP